MEPSPGSHLITWKGAWIKLDRVREQQQVDVIGKAVWPGLAILPFCKRWSSLGNSYSYNSGQEKETVA